MSSMSLRRRRHTRFTTSANAVFAVTLAAFMLRAAPALAGDEAAAEALFVEAKRLADEGKFAEACPKFAESNRLDRGAGTLIHLADCYQKNNQTASAWASFKDAASAAQALGRADWQKLATTRAALLEPKLAKLSVKVVEPTDKIEVTRDGTSMSQASWSTPIPVDVGMHTVAATAPGYKPFKATVMVTNDGDRKEVIVPRLEVLVAGAAPVAPGTPPADNDTPPRKRSSSQRTVGFVVGGVGVVGLAVGAVTGLVAIGKNSDSKKSCPDNGACANADAVSANDSARTFGTVSTIGFIAGAALVTVGAIVIFTAPPSPSSSSASASVPRKGLRVVPATDGRSGTMTVLGVF